MENFFEILINYSTTILIIILIFLILLNKFRKVQIMLFFLVFLIFFSPLPNIIVYSIESKNSPGNIENLKFDFDNIVILSGNEDVEKTKKFNHLYLGGTNNRLLEGIRIHNKYKKKLYLVVQAK